MPEPVDDMPMFDAYDKMMEWCMRVRLGQIIATPRLRQRAKIISFSAAYGADRTLLNRIIEEQ